MLKVESIKASQQSLDQATSLKQQYEQRLKEELLAQEVKLRAEMNHKLSEKDLELRKMIAELESRMMSRPSYSAAWQGEASLRGQQFEVDSDYSIDSSNISWKADLWELLPDFEKKKLY